MLAKLSSRLLSGYSLLFFVFLYAPVLLIVIYSFNSNPVNVMIWKEFTFDWYINLFGGDTSLKDSAAYVESTDQLVSALGVSLVVAGCATLVSTVLGTSAAVALARYRFRLQNFYRMLLFVPMVMPDIVLGIALLIFFVGVGVNLGVTSIIIGHCTFLTSYVFIVVSSRLAGMNPVIEAASADLERGVKVAGRLLHLVQAQHDRRPGCGIALICRGSRRLCRHSTSPAEEGLDRPKRVVAAGRIYGRCDNSRL